MKFIFEVRIHEGHTAEEYADAWVRASEIIQQAPGARGTELHRKIGDPDTLIAIIRSVAPFVDIRPLGEFEDPEWVVNPG